MKETLSSVRTLVIRTLGNFRRDESLLGCESCDSAAQNGDGRFGERKHSLCRAVDCYALRRLRARHLPVSALGRYRPGQGPEPEAQPLLLNVSL